MSDRQDKLQEPRHSLGVVQNNELNKALETLRAIKISLPQINFPTHEWIEAQKAANSAGTAIQIATQDLRSAMLPAIDSLVRAQNATAHLDLSKHFDAIANASRSIDLALARTAAIGKSSDLALALRSLGSLPVDERKETSKAANTAQMAMSALIALKGAELEAAELDARLKSERIDLTLPSRPRRKGAVHPTMQVMDEMVAIFAAMGFAVAEGP